MIVTPKKVIFIALIFVTLNEVNSTPAPKSPVSDMWDHATNLVEKAKASVRKFLHKTTTSLVTGTAVAVDEFLYKFDCFSRTHLFDKLIDAFFTDKTTEDSVKFYFATQSNPNYTTVAFDNNEISLDHVDFNPLDDTVLISHGFQSNGRMDWLRNMKDAFLNFDAYNVIVVDWEKGSNTWNYIDAAATTQIVGNAVGRLFGHIYDQKVKEKFETDEGFLGEIHFVGHSLGAHIVARGANKIKEDQEMENRSKDWIVKRITGLDPAQPCFILVDKDKRLDENDAEFVDVIHTNARHLILLGLGLPERIGHFDFYPNGGQMQPGCPINGTKYEEVIWNYVLTPKKMVNATVCSHGRSYEFFTESIIQAFNEDCQFISHAWDGTYDNETFPILMRKTCESVECLQMGIKSINHYPREKGIYFTPTGHKKPYCVVGDKDEKLISKQLLADASLNTAIRMGIS